MIAALVMWLALAMMLVGCGTGTQPTRALNTYFPSRKSEDKAVDPAEECSTSSYLVAGVPGVPYFCDPKTHKWVEDKKQEQWEFDEETHRQQLARDLITKCVSVQEMQEIASVGSDIYVMFNQSYTPSDVQARYISALQVQQVLCEHKGEQP